MRIPPPPPAHLPSLRQLRYFVALEERRHFARAADACAISQSAFSVAIRELESLLGARLVDRTNKRVTITALGAEVAAQARLVLRDAESLVEMARGPGAPLGGRLALGVIPTVAPFLVSAVMARLEREHPDLEVYLREDVTARLVESLLAGRLDAVVLALPHELRHVMTEVLFRDPLMLACRPDTRHIDPQARYHPGHVPPGSVLLLEDGHCLRDQTLLACRLRDRGKLSRYAASSLFTLVQMVDADLGITFLPAMAEGSSLTRGTRLRTYPLARRAYREVALAWRRGSGRDTEFGELATLIRGAASDV